MKFNCIVHFQDFSTALSILNQLINKI